MLWNKGKYFLLTNEGLIKQQIIANNVFLLKLMRMLLFLPVKIFFFFNAWFR